jgi:hypothetical protein
VWGNGYILDQGTDATAQQESSNPIHQRKEQLLGQLLYLPDKCYEVKFAASLIPLTRPKLSREVDTDLSS